MNSLTYLLQKSKPEVDPIALDEAMSSRFNSWEQGFDAHKQGLPLEACNVHGRARPLWREGWHASKRIEDLMDEQAEERGEW